MDVMSYVMGTSQINPNVLKTVLDDEIKRKGGAKIDELRFDLDVEETIENRDHYINFTNMDQIKKVLDNDMNIVILYRYSGCGDVQMYYREYYRCNTAAKLSGTSAVVPSQDNVGRGSGGFADSNEPITVTFETEERLIPVSAKYKKYYDEYEILKVYATI